MAAYSPPASHEVDSRPQTPDGRPQTPDGRAAKKAIARAAKSLRTALTDQENLRKALAEGGLLNDENTEDVIKELKENVGKCPNLFEVLIRELSSYNGGKEAADKLQHYCPVSKISHPKSPSCPESPAPNHATQSSPAIAGLKKKLTVLKDMNAKDEVIKTTIMEAIVKELKRFDGSESIKHLLSEMTRDEVISPEIFDWAIAETSKEYERVLAAANVDEETVLVHCSPAELDQVDLYHASMCTAVLNKSTDPERCKSLFQSLSHQPLKHISITQPSDQVFFPKCVIALFCSNVESSQDTVCYIAFDDFQFRELTCNAQKATFGEVLKCQIERFPMVFLENAVKIFNRIVLTGFSFGGVLAQMLAAQLWLLPQARTEELVAKVICITFGQPLIQSDLLKHVIEIYPEFGNNVHAICSDDDRFPFSVEILDSLTSLKKVPLHTVLDSLSSLQDFYLSHQEKTSVAIAHVNAGIVNDPKEAPKSEGNPKSLLGAAENDGDKVASLNAKIEATQSELEHLLRSHSKDPETHSTASRQLILHGKSDLKLVQMNKSLQDLKFGKKAAMLNQDTFEKHSAEFYYRSVKKLTSDDQNHNVKHVSTSTEFLCPNIEHVKVTKYERDAIIVVTGKQLFFVHSVKLSSIIKDPFQVQELSVCFKTNADNVILENQQENEVIVYSHFYHPVQRRLQVELDTNTLSPRGRQLAVLEPSRLLEFGLMISLLEMCPNRSSGFTTARVNRVPAFINYFKRFLHDIAAVTPYESLLATLAQCSDVGMISERYVDLIQKLCLEFPFSLSMYTSLFVTVFKIQHQESTDSGILEQLPFEECAYFMWMKAKYTKGISTPAAVNSFALEVFTDPYIFGSQDHFSDDALYLQKMVQSALKHVNKLSEVEATSTLSASNLYKWESEEATKTEAKNLKSPISVLLKGREALQQVSDISKPHLDQEMASIARCNSYEKAMKVLHKTRGIHFDFCIRVLCDFMCQHVRIPFTEANPMTNWKCLCHQLAPYSDILKNDSQFWASMLKRCQRATSRGSQVAERTYNDKLKFLVNNIDPKSTALTAPTFSQYSMYTLEKKLKELCSNRKIKKETSIDQIAHAWRSYFQDCPMLKVAASHRTLIGRWIKWSLLIHELRTTLENHVVIAITGLVNSGKTQLIKSLFGFQVKAGTVESRRTIIPFMYSLAPEVEGVHVVDLPGADDSDKNVLQLTEFLKSISQVVIFAVSYDKAHTKDALKWLNIYEKRSEISADEHSNPQNTFASIQLRQEESDVPVLVCMTFADRLLAEMMDRDGKYNPSHAKIEIGRHFEEISTTCYKQHMWIPKGRRTLGFYCLDLSRSSLCEGDMKAVNIGVPSDIGRWLCKQLREEIYADSAADKLEKYIERNCSELK